MRKFFAFTVIFATWYFAGMNAQSAILASVISLLIILLMSFIFSRIMRSKIDIYIPLQKRLVFKNREDTIKISAKNKSRLPLNRIAVKLEMKYKTDSKGTQKKLNTGVSGYTDGDTASEFYFTAPYCGLLEINIKKVRIYDYFGFFSNSKKVSSGVYEIFILPEPKIMNLYMPAFGTYTSHPVADSSSNKAGDDHSEIRLLREYRDGDLMKHIHRNLSTRTEKLWVKEYNRENDFIFDLFLDTSDTALTTQTLDALYEIVFTVLGSLIEKETIVKLHWYDRNSGGIRIAEISDRETLHETVPLLYKSDLRCTSDEFHNATGNIDGSGMLINSQLEWYFNNKHIYTFNNEAVEHELIENVFDLRR